MRNRITTACLWLAGLAAVCLPAGPVFAQGCAMCYNDAAAAKASAIKALQHGTLILGIPVLAMFIAIFVVAYVHRDRFNEPEPAHQELDSGLNEWLRQPPATEPVAGDHEDEELPCPQR